MAKDGLSIKLEGGARLDRLLLKVERQSVASRIVNQSLKQGGTVVAKGIKQSVPKDKQTLKKSVKTKLMNKAAKNNRHLFMAGIYFQFSRDKGRNTGEGAWYHHLALRSHKTRGGGSVSNTNPVPRIVKQKEGAVRKRIGEKLADKIATQLQKQIDALR